MRTLFGFTFGVLLTAAVAGIYIHYERQTLLDTWITVGQYSCAEAVERAETPLRAKIIELEQRIAVLKTTISVLEQRAALDEAYFHALAQAQLAPSAWPTPVPQRP